MLIFVHIPKTAGTSFKNLLCKVYTSSETIVIDSDSWYKNPVFSLSNNRNNLPGSQQILPSNNIKYIVGHFNADRFLKLYPDATYITWVRDPIQRLYSNYNYYLRTDPRVFEIKLKKRAYDLLDFETYSTHRYNTNTMCQQLNIPLFKFKFIGIVEKYDKEIERFKKITNINITNDYNYTNLNPEKKNVKETYQITQELRNKLMDIHAEDYKLYNECLKIAGY